MSWVIGKTFTDETIQLEGVKHENCTFVRCRFNTVNGPDAPYIVGCDFIDCPDHKEAAS